MYIPNKFTISDLNEKHQFINEFAFGLIVSAKDTLQGTHLPFVLHPDEGDLGVLYAHCAKANPHWKVLENADVLVVFNGPHAYISPGWYASGPAVPTWNYAAVHAYGRVVMLSSEDTLKAVEELVEKYEADLLVKRDILTENFRDKLLPAIVGFKIVLSKIEGKLKLGQQRSIADQQGVYQGLCNSSHLDALALARYMEKLSLGKGN
jgi:transcriptional regulator